MRKIYILGSINVDLVSKSERLPNKGETIIGNGFFIANGGKGANQAVACARAGGNVKFLGAIGEDSLGKNYLKDLEKENIDLSNLKIIKEKNTGTAVILLSNGDNRIILDQGANVCITKSDIDNFLSDVNEGDIFLTQLENNLDAITYALKLAKEKKMYVILNPAPANKEIIPYLKYCDLITPNEGECELLGGLSNLSKIVKTIIVTKGDKGYSITEDNITTNYPVTLDVNVVDTTGAGDTLCGVMCAYLSKGKSIKIAAELGSIAATLACSKFGAQPSFPYIEDIEKYCK